MQAPGGKEEDLDGGFRYGGWTMPYWHDDIGLAFDHLMGNADAILLGRRTYVTHAEAFEPMPAGDRFGDLMNTPRHYVVSKTLTKPIWRNTTIIRDNPMEAIRALKNEPGKHIVTDGSSQLVHDMLKHDLVDELHLLLYPLSVGGGKRVLPDGVHTTFSLKSVKQYPTGVVGLHYERAR
jgi:dihydrofolate reductase